MTSSTRYASAAVLACVYTALIAWLVEAEARSYRRSLRHERGRERAAMAPKAPAPLPAVPPLAATPSKPETAIARTNSDSPTPPSQVTPAPASAPIPASAPAPAPVPSSTPAEVVPKALASSATAKPEPAPSPSPSPSPSPRLPESPAVPTAPPPRSPGAVWADTLDLARLTPEEEERLGAELHRLVLESNPVDRDGDLQRLKRAAAPLLATVARKEVEYKFTILDSDEVNAFSLPGGYLYVSRGLFRLVGEEAEPEQDYMLQFALGHEIAHVDLKHTLTVVAANQASTAKSQGSSREVDTLNRLMVPTVLGYPDAQEFAADAWSYQRMTTRLEKSRREALMFLVKLQGFSERNGFRNGRGLPDMQSGRTLAENHYRAHPAAWDRLERLKVRGARPALKSEAEKGQGQGTAAPPR